MDLSVYSVARKYASAFLNLHMDKITLDDYYSILKTIKFLEENIGILFFLNVPSIEMDFKFKVVEQLFKKFKLNKEFNDLVKLLIKQKRPEIFKIVLLKICEIYRTKKNIESFVISSSSELNKEDIDILKSFLEEDIKKNIIYSTKIDPDLIAGIKILSANYFWEYSIRQKVKKLYGTLIP